MKGLKTFLESESLGHLYNPIVKVLNEFSRAERTTCLERETQEKTREKNVCVVFGECNGRAEKLNAFVPCNFRDVIRGAIMAVMRTCTQQKTFSRNDAQKFEENHIVFSNFLKSCQQFDLNLDKLDLTDTTDTKLANSVLNLVKEGHARHHNCSKDASTKEAQDKTCTRGRLQEEFERIRGESENIKSVLVVGVVGEKSLKKTNLPTDVVVKTCKHPSYALHLAEASRKKGTSIVLFFSFRARCLLCKSHSNVVTGKFVGTHLSKLENFKKRLLVSVKEIVSSLLLDTKLKKVSDVALLRMFESLSFKDVTGLELDMTVSNRRRRFWTQPPREFYRQGEFLYDSLYPGRKIFRLTILDKKSFFLNHEESDIFKFSDFGFSNFGEFEEFVQTMHKSLEGFNLYYRREEKAKTSMTVTVPRSWVKAKYRDVLYDIAVRASRMRERGLINAHVDVLDIALMADPSKRHHEFLERFFREDGRDALCEVYTNSSNVSPGQPPYCKGDCKILRSLAVRDGATLFEHIPRMLFKMLPIVGALHIQEDLKSVREELEEIVMQSIGIDDYINKTAKEMHRAHNVNLKHLPRKLSDEQKKQVIELFKKHVEDAAGAKRRAKGIFEHSDALWIIQKCRIVQDEHKKLNPEIKTKPVSLVPIPNDDRNDHCHSHATMESLNVALSSMSGSSLRVDHITDILENPERLLGNTRKKMVTYGVTEIETRKFGKEISFNGYNVCVRYSFSLCFNYSSTHSLTSILWYRYALIPNLCIRTMRHLIRTMQEETRRCFVIRSSV